MENTFTNILPEDFDGVFYFSNWSNEDFMGSWAGKSYTYPANKMTPMFIMEATPLEIQNIRKKFAKEFAEREFFKSKRYDSLRSNEGAKDENGVLKPLLQDFHQARAYTTEDLSDYIQRCLTPLPKARQVIMDIPKERIEEKLTRDDDGVPHTQIALEGKPLKLKK